MVGAVVTGGCGGMPTTDSPRAAVQTAAERRDVFFAGGRYVGTGGQEVMQGAMYVEHLAPARVTQKYPVVFFHGAAQTAVNWITTPDGRPGWASYFLDRGYDVYLVDQPARGRSAWHPGLDGTLTKFSAPKIEMLFTDSAARGNWPQAKLHTQWPGTGPNKGRMGDSVFDQFYSSQVEYLGTNAETQALVKQAGTALLDRIGPAVLITHSQAGPFGWLLADARPQLVKAIVSVEPNGPPIESSTVFGAKKQLAWGVADVPITYDPPVMDASTLDIEKETTPERPQLMACWRQKAPARQLPNLKGIPITVLITEASFHSQYDHCTARWLSQAGVPTEIVRLEEIGLRGNGHMVMLEKNSNDVAAWIDGWLRKTLN
ncbi:hypothetical protein A2G96_22105 [Cupriavidus nantongensis]|uniref:AB hydrolase-1 domain-containing protein n=2 Tax=Cupriavidus nantongensis TaxID=1796606 RepID=A0A142JW52_9BURK|nr:hypothetical protein A2G96_22105 [Cupriavidus nantongensis]